MATYSIFQRDQLIGTLTARGEQYTLDTESGELERAVRDVLRQPALRVWGRVLTDTTVTQQAELIDPGQPGHLDAAITNGSLIPYGYIGRRED